MRRKKHILMRWVTNRWFICPLLFILIYPLSETVVYSMMRMNGFVIDAPLIPAEEIHQGGPPRDGIPSIDNPSFIKADNVTFLKPDDRVLGIKFKGISKAYAIRIMNYHELVNDDFSGHPVLVSFCSYRLGTDPNCLRPSLYS